MERLDDTSDLGKKANRPAPSALIIFDNGFEGLPLVVPNSGTPEGDEAIMRWLARRLLPCQRDRQAA